MMAEEKNSGGPSESRIILGDLTNRIGKRGLSGKEKNEIKSCDFGDKDAVKRICVSPPPCTQINCLKGNVISSLSKRPDENRDPNVSVFGSNFPFSKNPIDFDNDCHGGYSLKGKNVDKLDASNENMILGNVEVVNEDKCLSIENFVKKSAVDPEIFGCGELAPGSSENYNEENGPKMFDLGENNATTTEAQCESGGSFLADTSRTVSESGNDFLVNGQNCDAGEENLNLEGSQSEIRYVHNDVDDHNADNFVLSQSGSIDCTVQPESLKEDECAYMSGKDCSCSFCTRAAYMWLDLNYQDMRARLSVMRKSQKDASILAERSSRTKFTEKSSTESFTRASNLESHLIYQWRSLFQRTAELWEKEGNQLESSLLPLTELREKCKTDLELINAKRTKEQQH